MNVIQKIKDYDFQKNMKFYYRESRDLWMSATIEKARELKLMSKVADNWQAKLIDQNEIIGQRLKFSVGHNHVTITIGNPITLCNNYKSEKNEADNAISMCSRKDVYNWQMGAIQSLDNLCEVYKYSQKLRRYLRKSLAKKYPEVFSV
jgi:hypothetical protein